MEFVHLHVHSQYSFLDGASTLDALLIKAKKLGMPALAITDHNRLTCAIRFYDKAISLGIRPIIGAEVDIEGGYHLTLLCRNITGYSNLCKLLTEAHLSNRNRKPCATSKMLRRFNSGMIALSGCSRGQIPSLVTQNKMEEARQTMSSYQQIFHHDFFVELINHPSREGSSHIHVLAALAREQNIPVVATNNVHYANMQDYRIKELLNSIERNIPVSMLNGQRTVEQYLKSPREMAGRLLPNCFEDIIDSISLVRPGPLKSNMDKTYLARRHGQEPVTYIHPSLKAALEETLGVVLYQEQVLRVAHDLAGMSYTEADGFRRAMTHNRTEAEMEKMRDSFISQVLGGNISSDIAEKVFEQLSAFAAYGFCKAHAVAYAMLAYQTLWLKCHYPAEFFAALLSNHPVGYYPPRVLIADARRFGINILPLDINESLDCYTVENGSIRVGLSQLKGITSEQMEHILKERAKRKYLSLRDFILRTNVSQPTLENMAKIGAFESFGNRNTLLMEIPSLLQMRHSKGKDSRLLFEETPQALGTLYGDQGEGEIIQVERELLSLGLSGHPLDLYNTESGFKRMRDLPSLATGTSIKIAGSVIRYQTPPTRNGKRVVYVIIEDGTGIADVTVFSDVQEKCGHVLFRSGWLEVQGKIQRRGATSLSIIAQNLYPLPILSGIHT